MDRWYIYRNGCWIIETRTNQPKGEAYKIEWGYPWPEVYEIHTDEDGTKTVLLSEVKLANKIDQERAKAYKNGENWDLKIEQNS